MNKPDFSIIHRPGVIVCHIEIKDRLWKKIACWMIGVFASTCAAFVLKFLWQLLSK